MLRKIGSFFISVFMLIFVGILSVFIGVRLFLQPSSLTLLMSNILEKENFWENTDFVDSEFKDYVDVKKINEELGKSVSDYIKYILGIDEQNKPNVDGFRNLIDEYISEYEKDNNVKLDREEIDQYINGLEQDLEKDLLQEEVDDELKAIIKVFFSNKLIYILVGVILFSIVLDYLLRKSLAIVSLHTGIVTLINAVTFFGMGISFKNTNNVDKSFLHVFDLLINICNKIGFVSLVLGVILIVLFIIFRDKKKPDNENMNMSYNYNN